MNDWFYGSISTLIVAIPCFPRRFTFLIFYPSNLSFTFGFFYSVHSISAGFTSGPIGPGGRLGDRPCSRPWAGPSACVPAGLLSAGCCPVPRAAGLAGVCCRAGLSAAGRTARAEAAPAWAVEEARAEQAWPPKGRWTSPVSPIPASPVCWLARRSRCRWRMPSSFWRWLWWRLRWDALRPQPRCWYRRQWSVPVSWIRADQKIPVHLEFWPLLSFCLLRRPQNIVALKSARIIH